MKWLGIVLLLFGGALIMNFNADAPIYMFIALGGLCLLLESLKQEIVEALKGEEEVNFGVLPEDLEREIIKAMKDIKEAEEK